MNQVQMWTDGSSDGKTGNVGGWGVVLKAKGKVKELSGQEPEATNNRMELRAAIEGLKALTKPCSVTLHSDSEYVVNSMAKGWIDAWQKRNWMNSGKKPVANKDLWMELLDASEPHDVEWVHVRGHADDEMNNRADALAVAARGGPVDQSTPEVEPEDCIHGIPPQRCHVCSGRVRQMIAEDVPAHEMVQWLIKNDAWLPEELRG